MSSPLDPVASSDDADATRLFAQIVLGVEAATFVEVRPAADIEPAPRRDAAPSAWRGVIVSSKPPAALADEIVAAIDSGPLHLLIADESATAAAVVAILADRSIVPWLLVVPGAADGTPDPAPGLRHVAFDGVRDYFLAGDRISLATNIRAAVTEAAETQTSLRRWRSTALEGWNARGIHSDALNAQQELIDMKQTLSWRVTRPLRAVRSRLPVGTKS